MIEYNNEPYGLIAFLTIICCLCLIYVILNLVKNHHKAILLYPAIIMIMVCGILGPELHKSVYYTLQKETFQPEDFTYIDDGYEIVLKYNDGVGNRRSITEKQNYKHVKERNFIIIRYIDYNFFDKAVSHYDVLYTIMDKEFDDDKKIKIEI